MKRRSFIRSTFAGAALLHVNPLYYSDPRLKQFNNGKYASLSRTDLAVIDEVDVIVAGASLGGIGAAIKAAESGARVFVISYKPYMGEDICGTYKYLYEEQDLAHPLMKKLNSGNKLITPNKAKKILENELIDRNINFLYSTYVADVLFNEKQEPSGLVLINRMSRQLLLGKVIIDATHSSFVGKLAGVEFSPQPMDDKKYHFSYITIGGSGKSEKSKVIANLPYSEKKKAKVVEHSFYIEADNWSFSTLCGIEQKIRQETWNPDQLDAADEIFFIPPDKISGKESSRKSKIYPEDLSTGMFQPLKNNRLYILNGCADMTRSAVNDLLKPSLYLKAGDIIGKASSLEAQKIALSQKPQIKSLKHKNILQGISGTASEILRPVHRIRKLEIDEMTLPVVEEFDIVIAGGGTVGANAAISAGRHGMKVLVLEYLHGLGGMGTTGMIGRYWDGYRKGFTEEIDMGIKQMGPENHPQQKKSGGEWPIEWKKEWYRREIKKTNGNIWFGAVGCGAFVRNGKLKGVIIATPSGMQLVLSKMVIDSTGSGDIAIAAGAKYRFTDENTVGVQGCGLPPVNLGDNYKNTDWTFTDDNDAFDITRLYISAKAKFKDAYDVGKLSQTRERRRIEGEHKISVLDIINKRTYPDTISFHESSFDTHGYTIDPFFILRQPEKRNVKYHADVPLRSLLPKGIENILVTGLGASAHRDAMPVIRMQACLQNQGYSVGYLCAKAIEQKKSIKEIDIKEIQKHLVSKKILPERVIKDTDNFPLSEKSFENAAKTIPNDYQGLEVLLTDKHKAIPLLNEAYTKAEEKNKRMYAKVLSVLGKDTGIEHLIHAIKSHKEWDEGWNYKGMHQFGWSMSELDSLIIALGMTKREDALPVILEKAELLNSDDYFSHFRSVSIACETIKSPKAAPVLFNLLNLKGITGHYLLSYRQAREKLSANPNDNKFRNDVLKEIHLARALYRCGDFHAKGKQILKKYTADLHGHYFRHAYAILTQSHEAVLPDVDPRKT
ncbi:MAG: FAD-dependent oxidoreductase [Bacteroidota bacterium]